MPQELDFGGKKYISLIHVTRAPQFKRASHERGIFFSPNANWIGHYLLKWTNEDYPNSGNVWDSGWPFAGGIARSKSPCQMRTAGKTNLWAFVLAFFFGPTAQVVSMVGRLTENGDKINPKSAEIPSDWIWGSAVKRLQRAAAGSVVNVHMRTELTLL